MPDNQHAMLRYRVINECLMNRHRFWTKEALLEALSAALEEHTGSSKGISTRTLFADLKAMKKYGITGYDAPIDYSMSRGYHYTDPNYSINKTPLTSSDVVVLQQALQALQAIQGTGLATALDDIIHRLERRLAPVPLAEWVEAPIQFERQINYLGTQWLQSLYQAIQERHPQSLLYQPYHADAARKVVVHPYMLKAYQQRWFLVAHTLGKAELQVFALDRIKGVTPSNGRFVPPAVDVSKHFDHVIGTTVPAEKKPETIHLRFSSGRGPYVRTKPLHHSQSTVSDTPAGLEVTLYLVPNPELLTKLLGFGGDLEVLAPASLRVEVQKRLGAALLRYES